MTKLTRALALATGLFALGAAVTPALADFRFGINLGPPAYYYYAPAPYYAPYYYSPYYYPYY